MECKYCKSEVPEGSAFCNHCGKKLARAKKSDSEKKKYDYVRKSFVYEGKQYFVSGKTEREAARRLAEKEAAVMRGESGISNNMLVSAWAKTWLATYRKPKVREAGTEKSRNTMTQKSYEMYVQKLNGYILPAIGNLKVKDVKRVHLQNILNNEAGKSESHVKKLRMVINAMFDDAARDRVIPFNPADGLVLPATFRGARRSLTEYERKVLLQVAETHRCGLWVRFLLGTGIRPGESAPLQVYDLVLPEKNDQKAFVKIYKSIESGTEDVIGSPKTSAGERIVPIPAEIVPDVRKAVEGKLPDEFVFPQTDGKTMMTTTAISNNWRSFTRQMDLAMGAEHTAHGHIYDPSDLLSDGKPRYPDPEDNDKPRNGHKIAPDLVLYCLRHTYCTDLQRKGVPINIAKTLMGHEDISVTANIYSHTDEGEIARAGQIINEFDAKRASGQTSAEIT